MTIAITAISITDLTHEGKDLAQTAISIRNSGEEVWRVSAYLSIKHGERAL